MPTESSTPAADPSPASPFSSSAIKCSVCGAGSSLEVDGVVILGEAIERVCGGCLRTQDERVVSPRETIGLGIGVRSERTESRSRMRDISPVSSVSIPISPTTTTYSSDLQSRSLPSSHPFPWSIKERTVTPPPQPSSLSHELQLHVPPNPLLDVTKKRIPSMGRGCLYPGSIFRGTQTSGRSAYEVEIKFLDVSFPTSTLCGYLSISHLTDTHPHLTTFFTAEIIGPHYGFLTGERFGATEHDDMRHWGRFEQFRRPATRADMIRPELLLRDPIGKQRERDFVFLRIKERFLVPDHKVKDISGASFAGFYFAMLDLSPTVSHHDAIPEKEPMSPGIPSSPTIRRRTSDLPNSPTRERGRERSVNRDKEEKKTKGEATIRGYYFHSLNQEPFQELSLTHVPNRSSSTFEMR
ncbi:glucose-induced degradation protein 4, partial [Tremellales sp. Uapishka_1]